MYRKGGVEVKHNLKIADTNKELMDVLIADDKIDMVLSTLRAQLDYLYELLPNSFAEWNPDNVASERDEVEILYTKLTLTKDLYTLMSFENELLVLQTKAFEADMCAPVDEETSGVHKLTRADFLEMGFTEKQIDDTVRRLSR